MSQSTIQFTFKVNGTLTNPTSVKLSDPTGTYGVRRTDTSATVVNDNTSMTNQSTGVYYHTFTDPAADLTYQYYVEVVYNGITYYQENNKSGTSSGTSTLDAPYEDIRRDIGRLRSWGRDPSSWTPDNVTDCADYIKQGLRTWLTPDILPNERTIHEWSFLKPIATMTLSGAYSTGTVAIASGVVTLTTGTFPSWAASGELIVEGVTYSVNTRDSDSQVTLDDTSVTVAAGATYELIRPVIDLPSDFAQFNGPLTYRPGDNGFSCSIQQRPEHWIRERRQVNDYTGRPEYFALRPKTHDPTVGQRWEVSFYPVPDDDYVLSYSYRVDADTLSAVDKYALGGPPHAETMRCAIMAACELSVEGVHGVWRQQYLQRLLASVAFDRQVSAPDYYGYNGDRSDQSSDPYLYHNNSNLSISPTI
jgi:hypothetical protein